jgi:hypothetical protein
MVHSKKGIITRFFVFLSVSSEDFYFINISIPPFTAIEKIIFGCAGNRILWNSIYFGW